MQPMVIKWGLRTIKWQYLGLELVVAVFLVATITSPVLAAMRLQERSLYMNSSEAGETTFYRAGFRYMSPDPVGSVEMLFCDDPIPYTPCISPVGLDVSGANLSQQTGETGFAISQRSTNRLVLSRTAQPPVNHKSSYTLENVKNPSYTGYAFSIRLKTHASTDATGPQIDFGSMRGQIIEGVEIVSQVPPMLIFCLAKTVEYNCTETADDYYSDMGQLDPRQTLTAQSQMAIGTNASAGFTITANGTPMSAGTSVIDSLDKPTPSRQGENQFGINLVSNETPRVGIDPEGEWANAVTADDYSMPNMYKFKTGDIVAYSPNVSLMKKYTVSYVVNSREDLRAGVYTTSINFIATGRF